MIKPQTLKGFRDFLPQEARKRQYVITQLKTVFESFGFEPLETPVLEYEEVLNGKYGEEGDKLMYRFEDNGKRRVAMRYDQTVPLARVVAQYQSELSVPFKRYQIQNVWRADNTQKGRYREFLQCDIDTVGVSTPLTDAEIIYTAALSLTKLGFTKYKILINDRCGIQTKSFSASFELTDEEKTIVFRAIDKIKKIQKEGVIDELTKKLNRSREDAMEIVESFEKTEKTKAIDEIFQYLKSFGLIEGENFIFEPTILRGLDYYTSTIFEIEIEDYSVGSVCGGGRYDNLIGMFAGKQIPAVGFAFGFDRIIEAMEELKLFPTDLASSSTKVLVSIFSNELKQKSLEIASKLRNQNINTEIYLSEIKEKNPLEKQLKYADQKQIPYIIIIGPEEAEKNRVTLKNLQTREQTQKSLDEIMNELKK